MKIIFSDAGKRFYREWIFRHANIEFITGNHAVILGPNGSGKSTFLQVAAGAMNPTEGRISYEGLSDNPDNFFRHLSFASPYIEFIEEFTFREIVQFHFKFKKRIAGLSDTEIIETSGLASSADKVFRFFSSGMKQRVKLLLALMSETEVVMLDEPCSNLDAEGVEWYGRMIRTFSDRRMVIVASNHNEQEYFFCTQRVNIAELNEHVVSRSL